VERTIWDGIGLSDVGLPSESVIVVRVIGRGEGFEDGHNEDTRADRVFRDSESVGKAAFRSGGRSLVVSEDNEACKAFALDH
jgi:hypothetical protein